MSLHRVFNQVDKAAALVKATVKDGYFRQEREEQLNRLRELADKLSEIYGVQTATIKIGPVRPGAYACYNIVTKKINLTNTSIVSFLHEYRHHLQHQGNVRVVRNKEYDAQGWACSVYYKACPGLFSRAVQQGRIMGVKEV